MAESLTLAELDGRSSVFAVPFATTPTEHKVRPLTWGQDRVVRLQRSLAPFHSTLNLRWALPVRPGTTINDIGRVLRTAVENCQALRTTIASSDVVAHQTTYAKGTHQVRVLECAGDLTDSFAEAVADVLATEAFTQNELGIRICVLCARGRPRHIAIVMDHALCDYYGAGWVQWHMRDILRREFGPRYRTSDSAAIDDVLNWEASDRGRALAQSSIGAHLSTYRRAPATMLPIVSAPGATLAPRFRYLELRSKQLAACLAILSRASGLTETAFLYAALSLIVGRYGGSQRATWEVCVSNRNSRALDSLVAPLTQDVPTVLDLSGGSFRSIARAASGELLAASLRGRFPPGLLDYGRESVELSRGVPLDRSFWINSRLGPSPGVSPTVDKDRLGALRCASSLAEIGADSTSTSTLFVYLDRTEPDAIQVRILIDTAYLAIDSGLGLLSSLEDVIFRAAANDVDCVEELFGGIGDDRARNDGDWFEVDGGWGHQGTTAEAVARLLELAPDQVQISLDGGCVLATVLAQSDRPCCDLEVKLLEALRPLRVGVVPCAIRTETGVVLWRRQCVHAADRGVGL